MLNDRTASRPNSYGIVSEERTLIMRRCRGDGRLWNLDIPVKHDVKGKGNRKSLAVRRLRREMAKATRTRKEF